MFYFANRIISIRLALLLNHFMFTQTNIVRSFENTILNHQKKGDKSIHVAVRFLN